MSNAFKGGMLALNAALIGVLAMSWVGPWANRDWKAPPTQAFNLSDVSQAMLADNPAVKEAYPEVTARPLISPTRRPVSAPSDEPAPPPPVELDKLVLTGIVKSAGVVRVLGQLEGEPRSLKQGDQVGDWKLDSVGDRSVRFKKADEERELPLPYAHTPVPGTSAPVASPASPGGSATGAEPGRPQQQGGQGVSPQANAPRPIPAPPAAAPPPPRFDALGRIIR